MLTTRRPMGIVATAAIINKQPIGYINIGALSTGVGSVVLFSKRGSHLDQIFECLENN